MLQSNEKRVVSFFVLKEAGRMVRENAQTEYSKLLGQMDQLAAELRMSRHWLMARRANDRAVAARDFLIKRLDGYAPTGAMVTELRRLGGK